VRCFHPASKYVASSGGSSEPELYDIGEVAGEIAGIFRCIERLAVEYRVSVMRILHVVPSYYPAVRYGGPIQSVHALAVATVNRGHEVHVYTTNVDGPNEVEVPLGYPVDRDGVCIWYYTTGIGRRLYRSPSMGRALRSGLKDFDLVHLHSVFLWPTSAAGRVARKVGVPYIVAPRGMLVKELIRRKSSIAKLAWIGLFERRNLKAAAAVHVTSEIESNELRRLGFKARRIVLVPNGVSLPSIAKGDIPAVDICASALRPVVLFLGRVNWKKGLDRLIPAMAHVPEAELAIAGNDEENYQPSLLRLAKAAGVADRVRFLGRVDGTDKGELLRKATMLVLPSYSENFGNVILEAMAIGRPVVVTPEVGLAPTVRKANAGLVVDGRPETIAAAINKLLQDRELCRRMGEAGQQIVSEHFSWVAIAERMERVYEECLQEEKPCWRTSLLYSSPITRKRMSVGRLPD
jgi:glycosyltransferase involved in cell wall biosynthesis